MKTITKSLIAAFAAVACLTLSPVPKAFGLTPAPDGGYPNNNTAEGTNALKSLTSGTDNTAMGFQALFNNTTSSGNTATGFQALYHNTTASFFGFIAGNTANGYQALYSNTTGFINTATGFQALFSNTTGADNIAIGYQSLYSNTTGIGNVAIGDDALFNNTTGIGNVAIGANALIYNTTGFSNVGIGFDTLQDNTTGNSNIAIGDTALTCNDGGNNNTAIGVGALFGCIDDSGSAPVTNNTATGAGALESCNTGNNNTATGAFALGGLSDIGNNNTAEGFQALLNTTGSNNIGLGANAGIDLTTGSNNIDVGAHGTAGESNTIRIGTIVHKIAYMRGISGATVAGGVGVIVDTRGHLGTVQSSRRFKDEIKPMDKASEAILALKPVTFRYKKQLDPEGIPQFGLVAEQVEKVNPDLVARDETGQVNTVRYEAVNAMLLNEFLKEHRKVQELEAGLARQQKDFTSANAQHQKQIEALTATVQKVSDQLQQIKQMTPLVANNE
jgi:trimeric autotransporter adhesin